MKPTGTELAYLRDHEAGYTRRFSARVTALPPGAVVLDRTFFYPAGGGQRCDHGTLRAGSGPSLEVVDVTKSGATVMHRLGRARGPGFTLGDEVEGEVEWGRRSRHMRAHTGQHMLSALAFRRTGLRTRDASMSEKGGVIDLEKTWPPDRPLDDLAAEFADAVGRDLPVRILHVPRAEWTLEQAPRSGLVPLPAHVDPIRVIDIEALDRCPCGGTHVRSTGEIGRLTLHEPVPAPGGGSRIAFTLAEVDSPSPRA